MDGLRIRLELGDITEQPAISTGVHGHTLELAAPVAGRAVRDARASLEEVRFVLFVEESLAAFEGALTERRR